MYLSMGVLTFDITIRGLHSGTSPLTIFNQISTTLTLKHSKTSLNPYTQH